MHKTELAFQQIRQIRSCNHLDNENGTRIFHQGVAFKENNRGMGVPSKKVVEGHG